MQQRRFKTTGSLVEVDLSSDERVFLTELLDLLMSIPNVGDDPASRRLRVPVYLDDPESNDEWWRHMGEELTVSRTADRRVFQRVMSESTPIRLDMEEASSFLRVLNEGRLALAARFGLEVEEDHDSLPESQRDILDYLGWLLEELTSELTRAL
jgi:hypothetical protein